METLPQLASVIKMISAQLENWQFTPRVYKAETVTCLGRFIVRITCPLVISLPQYQKRPIPTIDTHKAVTVDDVFVFAVHVNNR